MKLTLSIVLSVCSVVVAHDDMVVENWSTHPNRLPEPISDHSATTDPNSGLIYLIGGCNAPTGNSLIPNSTYFGCSSVTGAVSIFDATTGSINPSVQDAPRPRYRHAAAYIQDEIWLIGGRDLEDNLIKEVDVYSIQQGKWLEDLNLEIPEDILTSDVTSFATSDTIFVAGGYVADYTAVKTTYSIDPAASVSAKSLVWEPRGDLNHARGDAHAALVDTTSVAYMVGGFTHLDGFCEALSSVEKYDFKTNTWSMADALTYERGDKALAVVGSRLFAIGGEANTDCALDPAQRTAPTTEVEVLDSKEGDEAKWEEEVADIPDDHFRFPAATYKDTIYTFGGQAYYQSECECFPTRDTILVYHVEEVKKLGTGAIAGLSIAAVLVVAVVMVLCKARSGTKERAMETEYPEQELKGQSSMN